MGNVNIFEKIQIAKKYFHYYNEKAYKTAQIRSNNEKMELKYTICKIVIEK